MTTGTITYYALSNDLELDKIEVSKSHSNVEKITIKTEHSDRISMTITLSNVYNSKDAGTIGDELVN